MKSRTLTSIIAVPMFVALTIPIQLAAQSKPKQHHYNVIDLGKFCTVGCMTEGRT